MAAKAKRRMRAVARLFFVVRAVPFAFALYCSIKYICHVRRFPSRPCPSARIRAPPPCLARSAANFSPAACCPSALHPPTRPAPANSPRTRQCASTAPPLCTAPDRRQGAPAVPPHCTALDRRRTPCLRRAALPPCTRQGAPTVLPFFSAPDRRKSASTAPPLCTAPDRRKSAPAVPPPCTALDRRQTSHPRRAALPPRCFAPLLTGGKLLTRGMLPFRPVALHCS